MVLLDPGHRRVDLAQCIPGQAGREQDGALVDEQVGNEDTQLIEPVLGIAEVGERGGQVTTGMGGQPALLARGRVIRLLAALEPQVLGARPRYPARRPS